jgi:hypothetical protein
LIIKVGDDGRHKLDKNRLCINHVVFCDCCEDEISYVSLGLSTKEGITSAYLDELPFRKSTYYNVKFLMETILDKPLIEKNIMIINDKHICKDCWKSKSGDSGSFMDKVRRILKLIKEKEKEND